LPCNQTFKHKAGLDYHNKLKHIAKENKAITKLEKEKIAQESSHTTNDQVIKIEKIETVKKQDEEIFYEEMIYEDYELLEEEVIDVKIEPIPRENITSVADQMMEEKIYEEGKLETVYICDFCGQMFKARSLLRRHSIRAHGDKNDFKHQCLVCKKKFHLKYDLQRHEIVHEDVRKMECIHCEKRFKTKATLESHIKTVHNNTENKEKKYQCDICYRSYYHRRHLEHHQRSHTNERLYSCDKCNESFLYLDAVKWHKIRKHLDPAPFECSKKHGKFLYT
jgi:C2H2-type zinc finger/Zinc finger, C2H2 type